MELCIEKKIEVSGRKLTRRCKPFGTCRKPSLAGWVTVLEEYEDGSGKIACELYNEKQVYSLSYKAFRFLMNLDGFTTIENSAAMAGLDEDETAYYLSFFCENALIRTGRRMNGSAISLVGRHEINPSFAVIYNNLLSVLFIPVFIIGCILLFTCYDIYGPTSIHLSIPVYISVLIGSLGLAITTHELSHSIASSGTVFDAGLFFKGIFIGGGYVIAKVPKTRSKEIRFQAAGIKTNILLAGICAVLCFNPDMYLVFSIGFYLNVVISVWNLLPFHGSDGFMILCTLLKVHQDGRNSRSLWRIVASSFRKHDWIQTAALAIVLLASVLTAGMIVISEAAVIIGVLVSL